MKTREDYMKYCLNLGEQALEMGNPPVGAILVHKNEIIGEGIESGKSTGDITNHAEILAVRDAINKGHAEQLKEAKMYTTHEPCIMCSYLIRHHKILMIIYGISVDYIGGCTSKFNLLETESIPKWGSKPKIISGILKNECSKLSNKFELLKK